MASDRLFAVARERPDSGVAMRKRRRYGGPAWRRRRRNGPCGDGPRRRRWNGPWWNGPCRWNGRKGNGPPGRLRRRWICRARGPSGGFGGGAPGAGFAGGYPGHGGPGRPATGTGTARPLLGPGVGILRLRRPELRSGTPDSDYYDYNNCYGYGPDQQARITDRRLVKNKTPRLARLGAFIVGALIKRDARDCAERRVEA